MEEPAFTLTSSSANGRCLEVSGELDLAARSALNAALAELLDGGRDGRDVTIDLSAVTFIDSTALACLVHANTEAARAGGRMVVMNPSRVVVRILHLAGLLTMLDIEGTAG